MASLRSSASGSLIRLQQGVGQGRGLIWILNWGKIHFCSFLLLAELIFSRAIRLRASVPHWFSVEGCLEFLALWASLLHQSQQEKASTSKTDVTILCNVITEVILCDIWFCILNLHFYWFEVIDPALKERGSHKRMDSRRGGSLGAPWPPQVMRNGSSDGLMFDVETEHSLGRVFHAEETNAKG